MRPPLYRDLLRLAGRARPEEAEDIVQDALLAAVAAGRTRFDEPATRAWLAGTIRNRIALAARSAVRMRRRDTNWLTGRESVSRPAVPSELDAAALPSGLKAVLALVLSGHSRGEIAWLLRLSDPALRQRIAALRRVLRASGVAGPEDFTGLSAALDHGRIRQALRPLVGPRGGHLASHDPDGHLFVVAGLTKRDGTATGQ